tara:strand:- start:3411 stop:3998 length:588 start_codon:yes stop_codon:yes gene_type:complete
MKKERKSLAIRIDEGSSALLIIDVQDKLIKGINNKEIILYNIKKLIDTSNILKIHNFFTEQYPLKLGTTVQSITKDNQKKIFSKLSFSCLGCNELLNTIQKSKVKNLILCGIETHVCVLQTSLDLIDKGFNVFISLDATGTRKSIDHEVAIRRLELNGAIVSTTESIIFELCKTADREEFKSISEIIKRPVPRVS